MTTKTLTSNPAGYAYSGGNATLVNPSGVTNGAASTNFGVSISGTGDTLLNAGQILANKTNNSGIGVTLSAGGSVTNQLTGTINASYGVEISGGTGTVQNLGQITAFYSNGRNYGRYGVVLSNGGVVVNGTAGGTISAGTISGYYGAVKFGSTGTGTLINYGAIIDQTLNYFYKSGGAVLMQDGGFVINGPSGDTSARITASGNSGVRFNNGAGTVVNYGTIIDQNAPNGGTSANVIYYGVELTQGGTVSNIGSKSLIDGYIGVYGKGGVTVITGGTIAEDTPVSSTYIHPAAVIFGTGTNRLIVDPGAVFVGAVTATSAGTSTLEFASAAAAGTIGSLGSQFSGFPQIVVDSGARWTFSGSNSIASGVTLTNNGTDVVSGTLINFGRITATSRAGIYDTGHLTNQSGATIVGYNGILITATTGVVVNAGSVGGTGAYGAAVVLQGGSFTNQSGGVLNGYAGVASEGTTATISNTGAINGRMFGVSLSLGAIITNASGGLISSNGTGIFANGTSTTLNNSGLISAEDAAVVLAGGGTVTNNSGGTITAGLTAGVYATIGGLNLINAGYIGGPDGVYAKSGGTVTNQSGGTIAGTTMAVAFASGFTNRLVVRPSAAFVGTVTGGNTIGAANISTLELASAATAGTFSGLGTQFIDFAQVTIDSGAIWTLSGTAAGIATLNNAGTLQTGATLSGSATSVVNSGSIAGGSGIGVYLAAGGTMTNAATGKVSGTADAVKFAASHTNKLVVAPSASFTGTVDGGNTIGAASISTLELASSAVIGTLTGLGTQFVNFAKVTIDVGARWTLTGTNALLSGETLIDSGTLNNTGLISGGSYGVVMPNAALLTNQSTGTIIGSVDGVSASAAVTVLNAGSIGGGTNTGIGVYLGLGGTLTNQATGMISGGADAVLFGAGHIGRLVIAPSASFIGTVDGGNTIGGGTTTLEMQSAAAAGTLSGLGSQFTRFSQVTVDLGAKWTLSGTNSLTTGALLTDSGSLTNIGTLINAGRITGISRAIVLGTGGQITNQTGGTVTSNGVGVAASGNGMVTNAGFVLASTASGVGVSFATSGTVTNQSGATITGYDAVLGISAPITVVNAGVLLGNTSAASAYGVQVYGGLLLTNQSTGTITGHQGINSRTAVSSTIPSIGTVINAGTIKGTTLGVYLGDGGTVTNSGVIIGATDAVMFKAGFTNRLVVAPGGSFTGTVDGGNTIGAASISTLELASGAGTGTLGVLGSQFINFAQVTIDAGANFSIASGAHGFTTLADAGTITNGLSLGSGTVVLSVQATGAINGGAFGIYDKTGVASVVNAGRISSGTTAGAAAVTLSVGGPVTNQTGGTISGYYGVKIAGAAGTVSNAGLIAGNNSYGTTVNTVVSGGTTYYYNYVRFSSLASGVFLQAGGAITNLSGGTIRGYDGIKAGAAVTVVNTGLITGGKTNGTVVSTTVSAGTTTFNTATSNPGLAAGVYLHAGGSVTNQATGTITGYFGVKASTVAATVVNAGVIAGDYKSNYNNASGIYLGAGGSVTNQAGGAIYGVDHGVEISGARGTVINLGSIHTRLYSGYGGRAVSLDQGGVVVNGAPGGTVSTAKIVGYNGGVYFGTIGTDTLVNYGTVSGAQGSLAVYMYNGLVINGTGGATGALIVSGLQNNAIQIAHLGTVVNYGTIDGRAADGESHISFGVSVGGSGTATSFVNNLGSKALIVGYLPVYAGQNATVTNGGTIYGYQTFGGANPLYAVVFGGGTNRLIVDPGATFVGKVVGSGPATLAPGGATTILGTANGIGTTTLELASAASAGTISGPGTKYTGFAQITIDSGAVWTIAGANTIASGVTLANSGTETLVGTLANAGLITAAGTDIFVGAGGRITNQASGVIATSGTSVAAVAFTGTGTLINAGTINASATTGIGVSLSAGGALTNQSGGTISGGADAVLFASGHTNLLVAAPSAVFVGAVNGGNTIGSATISTLELASGAGTGTLSGLGAQFTDFARVTVDAGASWTISGTASGFATLANAGKLQSGVTLAAGSYTITNQSGGTIAGTDAIYANGALSLVNAGAISGNTTNGVAVALLAGGSVSNASGGTIIGGSGISVASGAASILNAGLISGNNSIAGDAAVILTTGTLTNQSTGTLTGLTGISASGAATVVNLGHITANSAIGTGVLLAAGGVVTNQASGAITGAIGITIAGAAGTVVNAGSVSGGQGAGNGAVLLAAGGSVTNQSGGALYGGYGVSAGATATVQNAGSIGANTSTGTAVLLAGGGLVSNLSGGVISGYLGIDGQSSAITVVNTGAVRGNSSNGTGVFVADGGAITNQSGGTITGYRGIFGTTAAIAVLNSGSIGGNTVFGTGVSLDAGGSVTNQSSGTITGYRAIVATTDAATVVNAGIIKSNGVNGISLAAGGIVIAQAGTITGTTDAVKFGAGATARLVIDPGVKFSGSLNGGNTIGATSTSTLELASAASAGTMSGLGSKYVNFAQVTVDAGATWTLSSTNSLAHGATLTNAGTLIDSGTLTNVGLITGNTLAIALATGLISNRSGGTITASATAGVGISVTGTATVLNAGQIDGGTTAGAVAIEMISGGSVTNQSGGTISGYSGIYVSAGSAAIVNLGDIAGDGIHGTGILLNAGGTVTNAASASITGTLGVSALATTTVVNSGTIADAAGGVAVNLAGGGAVTNQTGGTLVGREGVYGYGGVSVVNAGQIAGTSASGDGVYLYHGGSVTNLSGGTITGGQVAVGGGGSAVTVFNLGDIAGTLTGAVGVSLGEGGTIVNSQSGSAIGRIYGYYAGIHVAGPTSGTTSLGAGTVTNLGTIIGHTNIGVELDDGGVVVNGASGASAASAYIYGGDYGVRIDFANIASAPNLPGTVTNYGTIKASGNGAGVELRSSGTVVNAASAYVSGYFGVQAIDVTGFTSTVVNAGTIKALGGSDLAVYLNGAGDRLIVDPGAVFLGNVNGGTGTLELASGTIAGTLTGLGTQFTGFTQTAIDTGASWTLSGSGTVIAGSQLINAGTLISTGTLTDAGSLVNNGRILLNAGTLTVGTLSGSGTIAFGAGTGDVLSFTSAAASANVISNMAQGQTLDLTGQTVTATDLINSNTLQISLTTGGPVDVTLDPSGSYSGVFFHFTNSGANSFITENTTPCYLAGTRIRTDRGEIPVEHLRIGDRVITLSGQARPIKWIGTRSYSSAFAAGNRDVIPIIIKAGALGENVPYHDLYVSPLHAMFLEKVLIQAEHLVNGESIRRCPEIDPIHYFHIELDRHDVIFAEGAPAETFVDCDSRGMFHNAIEFARLYPADDTPRWQFCAPRIESGPMLERVRRSLDARAGLPSATGSHGPLQGNLDGLVGASLTGWAFDPFHPDSPVTLDVLDGDGLIARVTANRFRGDLEAAGIGDGRHGFELRLMRGLSPYRHHELRIRRATDGRELPGSPLVIEPHDGSMLLQDAQGAIEAAASVASDPATLDGLMTELLQGVEHIRHLRSNLKPSVEGDDRVLAWEKGPRTRPKRALVIDDHLPRWDRDSDSHAIMSHIAGLRALGWQVEFVASSELGRGDDEAALLMEAGVKCHRAPLVASVEEVLRRNQGGFELVYLHRLSNAERYGAMVRRWQPKARVLYGIGDLHHVRARRQAMFWGDAGLLGQSGKLQARELAAMRLADAVLTGSPVEAEYLSHLAPAANIHLIPAAVTARRRTIPPHKRNGVAFIGRHDDAPDADAVRWLVDEIMPLMWRRDPDMKCLIVGGAWPDRLIRQFDPRVRVLGLKPRLDEVFDQVRLTVAPLRFASGLQGKVLVSLAAGVPSVMTSVAAEGLPLGGALRGLLADDAASIAERICDLHYQSGLHRVQVAAGLSMIEQNFSAVRMTRALLRAIRPDFGTQPVVAEVQPLPAALKPVVVWNEPVRRSRKRSLG